MEVRGEGNARQFAAQIFREFLAVVGVVEDAVEIVEDGRSIQYDSLVVCRKLLMCEVINMRERETLGFFKS